MPKKLKNNRKWYFTACMLNEAFTKSREFPKKCYSMANDRMLWDIFKKIEKERPQSNIRYYAGAWGRY